MAKYADPTIVVVALMSEVYRLTFRIHFFFELPLRLCHVRYYSLMKHILEWSVSLLGAKSVGSPYHGTADVFLNIRASFSECLSGECFQSVYLVKLVDSCSCDANLTTLPYWIDLSNMSPRVHRIPIAILDPCVRRYVSDWNRLTSLWLIGTTLITRG